jgi:hypothetical protein
MWRNEENSKDYFADIIEKHTEFKQLSGIAHYLNGDTEDFCDIECYTNLFNDMATLVTDDIKISDIKSSTVNNNWYFQFAINGTPASFSMPDTNTDWLSDDFVRFINEHLSPFTAKRFRSVFATGMDNVDQCYDIAFIDNETLEKLLQHEDVFAEGSDDE